MTFTYGVGRGHTPTVHTWRPGQLWGLSSVLGIRLAGRCCGSLSHLSGTEVLSVSGPFQLLLLHVQLRTLDTNRARQVCKSLDDDEPAFTVSAIASDPNLFLALTEVKCALKANFATSCLARILRQTEASLQSRTDTHLLRNTDEEVLWDESGKSGIYDLLPTSSPIWDRECALPPIHWLMSFPLPCPRQTSFTY